MKKMFCVVLAVLMCLSLTACGGSSSGGTAAPGSEQTSTAKPVTIKIAHGASESYHLHRALLKFKDIVEESGRFTVEIYPSSQFGNDTEMIESVKTGDLTMAVSPSSFFTDEVPSMALVELPYVFPDRAAALATLKGPWGQDQLDKMEAAGLHGLGFLENGIRHITNSKHEIHTPADLNGLKMRTMQVPAHVEYWNSVGCSAEGSPFPELYTNLSTKVFDGQENPIAHIYAQKFYEVQKYLTLSEHVYTAYIPTMTLDFWNGLSDEDRELMNKAFGACYDYQMELVASEEGEQLKEIQDYGCVVTTLPPEEQQALIQSAQPTLAKSREELGADVYDEFTTAVAEAAKG